MTTITALPTPPSRDDPANFATRADDFLGALPTFVTETNTVAGEVNTNATTATTQAGIATTQAGIATTKAAEALASAGDAAASAATALAAPGTSATSTTSLTIGTGSKSLTIQAGKSLVVGMSVIIASTASPSNRMSGSITSYNSGTGALVVNVTQQEGSGTLADWTISLGSVVPVGGGIANIVTATTATTLTSTKTLLQITPAGYGVRVTLPDATTCSEGGPIHIIDNKGAYPVLVQNSAGTLLGFIYGGVVSHISLVDNATAAGVWTVENSELVGASAQLLTTSFAALASLAQSASVALDANREILIGNNGTTSLVAVVYDKSTNTFGNVTTVRTANVSGQKYTFVSAGTDKVLVVSTNQTTAMEAVILSISGTTITVNTAATATLSATISQFTDGCSLIAVPGASGSFVTSYSVTSAVEFRAISVSGTTVTIGGAEVFGTAGGLIAATGDKVIAVSTLTTTLYITPYTVSGSTLTAGTGTTVSGGTMVLNKFAPLGTRWFAYYANGAANDAAIISLSGTTTTISVASGVVTQNGTTGMDAIVVSSSKVLLTSTASTTSNANILTDNAGTASAGTAILTSALAGGRCIYVDGTDVIVQAGTTTYRIEQIDCSGASPVLTKTIAGAAAQLSNTEIPTFNASNSVLTKSATTFSSGAYAIGFGLNSGTQNYTVEIRNGRFAKRDQSAFPWEGASNKTFYVGKSDSERWVSDSATVITKVELATGALA